MARATGASVPSPGLRAGSASRCIMCLITETGSSHPRPLCLDVHRVQRLAAGHEQAIAFRAAEADVAANLRQQDQADAGAVRGEDMNPVIAVAHPAGADPEIAVGVAADAVGKAGTYSTQLVATDTGAPDDLAGDSLKLHRGELAALAEPLAVVGYVVDHDVPRGFFVMRRAGLGNVDLLVIRR